MAGPGLFFGYCQIDVKKIMEYHTQKKTTRLGEYLFV